MHQAPASAPSTSDAIARPLTVTLISRSQAASARQATTIGIAHGGTASAGRNENIGEPFQSENAGGKSGRSTVWPARL